MRVQADYTGQGEYLRFDLYSVVYRYDDFHVELICSDLDLTSAYIMAGVDESDFITSVANTGWCGSRPEWVGWLPIVTLPRGGFLALDHLGFMMESLQVG